MNLNKFFTPETMPNRDMKEVAEYMGVNVAIDLMKHFPGEYIYVPVKPQVNIVKQYAKANPQKSVIEIAKDLHLSKQAIYDNLK